MLLDLTSTQDSPRVSVASAPSHLCLEAHEVQQHAVQQGVVHDAFLDDGLQCGLHVLQGGDALGGGLALQVVRQPGGGGRCGQNGRREAGGEKGERRFTG